MIRKLATVCALALFVLALQPVARSFKRETTSTRESRRSRKASLITRRNTSIRPVSWIPTLTQAELYLATAYAQQFDPDSPPEGDNEKYANNAIATFENCSRKGSQEYERCSRSGRYLSEV